MNAPTSRLIYLRWYPDKPGPELSMFPVGPVTLCTDGPLALPASGTVQYSRKVAMPASVARGTSRAGQELYDGDGLFDGARRRIKCRTAEEGFLLDTDDACFYVRRDGGYIERVQGAGGADVAVALGPCLSFALSLQGLFVLHTSAVLRSGRAVCFLGRSGAGKSTAARYLSGSGAGGHRAVDDMAPVAWRDGKLLLYRGFPQSNPGSTEVPGDARAYPVRALVWLEPGRESEPGVSTRLGSGGLIRRLVNSSVGAKLFDRGLLSRHLSFCAGVAGSVPGFAVTFPRAHESLPRLKGLVDEELSDG